MQITGSMVLAVATLSAMAAGGGVMALGKTQAPPVQPIPRAADGHYWADGVASSDRGRAAIHFLIDTGASTVALTADDAVRLGLKPDQLIYSRPVFTAQGEVAAAPVMLSRVAVGGVEVREVKALVLKRGPQNARPGTSLLGMSYLGRLSRIEATPDALTLRR